MSPNEKYVVATTYKGKGYFWRWSEKKGFVHIYDVSANQIIASKKILSKGVEFLRLIPEKGLLWAATDSFVGVNVDDRGEIALYLVKGLDPLIEGNVGK